MSEAPISRKVARNSMWLTLEFGLTAVMTLAVSILLARHFGPARLGNYNYLVWLTYFAGNLGTVGIPAMAQKYMAEYLSRNDTGVAYQIFRSAFRAQLIMALGIVLPGMLVVWPKHGWIGLWLVAAMLPRMLTLIPSVVNMASEDFRRNVMPAMAGNFLNAAVVIAAVWFDWDLIGLAVSHICGQSLELLLKFLSIWPNLRQWKSQAVPALDPAIGGRMRRFAFQGIGLLLLNALVLDRSDLILLERLDSDPRQLSFFSTSFTLVERLLLIPTAMGGAMGLNLMRQFGADRSRVAATAVASASYLLLIGTPLLLGAAALSVPLWMIYGPQFAPAAGVFSIMSILAVARLLLLPGQSLLQATENQGFLLRWGCLVGAVKIALGLLLIPRTGAVGAALSSGAGQALIVLGGWTFIARRFHPDLKAGMLGRIFLSACVMALGAWWTVSILPPLPGVLLAVATGPFVYAGLLRLTGALAGPDRERLLSASQFLPQPLRHPFNKLLWFVIPEPG